MSGGPPQSQAGTTPGRRSAPAAIALSPDASVLASAPTSASIANPPGASTCTGAASQVINALGRPEEPQSKLLLGTALGYVAEPSVGFSAGCTNDAVAYNMTTDRDRRVMEAPQKRSGTDEATSDALPCSSKFEVPTGKEVLTQVSAVDRVDSLAAQTAAGPNLSAPRRLSHDVTQLGVQSETGPSSGSRDWLATNYVEIHHSEPVYAVGQLIEVTNDCKDPRNTLVGASDGAEWTTAEVEVVDMMYNKKDAMFGLNKMYFRYVLKIAGSDKPRQWMYHRRVTAEGKRAREANQGPASDSARPSGPQDNCQPSRASAPGLAIDSTAREASQSSAQDSARPSESRDSDQPSRASAPGLAVDGAIWPSAGSHSPTAETQADAIHPLSWPERPRSVHHVSSIGVGPDYAEGEIIEVTDDAADGSPSPFAQVAHCPEWRRARIIEVEVHELPDIGTSSHSAPNGWKHFNFVLDVHGGPSPKRWRFHRKAADAPGCSPHANASVASGREQPFLDRLRGASQARRQGAERELDVTVAFCGMYRLLKLRLPSTTAIGQVRSAVACECSWYRSTLGAPPGSVVHLHVKDPALMGPTPLGTGLRREHFGPPLTDEGLQLKSLTHGRKLELIADYRLPDGPTHIANHGAPRMRTVLVRGSSLHHLHRDRRQIGDRYCTEIQRTQA